MSNPVRKKLEREPGNCGIGRRHFQSSSVFDVVTKQKVLLLTYDILWFVMLCSVMLWFVMLCFVMLWFVMLCFVMLWFVMLCYVMVCYVLCLMFIGLFKGITRVSRYLPIQEFSGSHCM